MEPQLADNIGMVARAMANFGLDDLRLIAPRDGWPNEKARIAASGANYIIDDAVDFPTLDAAIGDFNWLAATTARQRDLRKPVLTPIEAVAEMRRRIDRGERCGVLFGRERSGLETSEVANADALIMIPVNSRFASLNLAQAVLILGYEWMRASDAQSLGRVTTYEKPLEAGLYIGRRPPGDEGGAARILRSYRGRAGAPRLLQPAAQARHGGAKSTHDVLADGRHRAGSPHPPWYCCNAREGQGTCPQAVKLTAIIWPSFEPSDAAPNGPDCALQAAQANAARSQQ